MQPKHTPNWTDRVLIDDILSPLTSGMSLKKAITMEKIHIIAVTKNKVSGITGSLERWGQGKLMPVWQRRQHWLPAYLLRTYTAACK